MKQLLKYEFRKTRSVKIIVFLAAMIFEALFLIGLPFKSLEKIGMLGMVGLVFTTVFGIFMIGIIGIGNLYTDLNTKQGYMLFMTPRNGYQVIGAKVLENGLSLLLGGIFFGILGSIDLMLVAVRTGDFIKLLNQALHSMGMVEISPLQIFWSIAVVLLFWLSVVTMAFFAVTLQAAILNGKRFGGLISIMIFIGMNILVSLVFSQINRLIPMGTNDYLNSSIWMIESAAVTVALYFLTGWIVEKKLSI